MDIRCPICGEPWDHDSLHDEVSARYPRSRWYPGGKYSQAAYDPLFAEVQAEFRTKGCELFGSSHGDMTGSRSLAARLSAELMDLLGDDIDGVMSELSDAEYLGLI